MNKLYYDSKYIKIFFLIVDNEHSYKFNYNVNYLRSENVIESDKLILTFI